MSAVKVKESDIQRLILDWLSASKIWHMRLNTGAMAGVHKGKKWFVRFGKPGMADILSVDKREVSDGYVNLDLLKMVWIEVKAPNGIQSADQKSFQSEVEAQGMKYILAHSLEDVIEGLK